MKLSIVELSTLELGGSVIFYYPYITPEEYTTIIYCHLLNIDTWASNKKHHLFWTRHFHWKSRLYIGTQQKHRGKGSSYKLIRIHMRRKDWISIGHINNKESVGKNDPSVSINQEIRYQCTLLLNTLYRWLPSEQITLMHWEVSPLISKVLLADGSIPYDQWIVNNAVTHFRRLATARWIFSKIEKAKN